MITVLPSEPTTYAMPPIVEISDITEVTEVTEITELTTVIDIPTTDALEETTAESIITTTESDWKSLGTFEITAYCPDYECSEEWGDMTSTGVRAKEGRTIAVDPRVIPYGSEVRINGHTYIAEDCGGAIKGNDIDIYFDTHEEAKEFGVQYAEVELFVGGD